MIDSNSLPLVAASLVFVAILLFFTGIVLYTRYRRARAKMLDKIRSDGMSHETEASFALQGSTSPGKEPFVKLFGAVGARLHPAKSKDYKHRNLDFLRAGIRRSNALAVFWGAKCLLAMFFSCIFLLLQPVFLRLLPPTQALAIGLIVAAIGFYLPNVWLRLKIAGRRRKLQDGLPDALDLLVVCVESGMSLDAAIHRVGEEIALENKDLSDELMMMNLEIRAGKLRRDAMRNLALRTNLEDVSNLVALLIQTDKFGTSVAQALRVYSDSFRTKRAQRAEELAAKLPVKLLLPLILFIFPCIFVVILGPAIIRIFRVFLQK